MSDTTAIGWADKTWSPWYGCEPVHLGCANCYARKFARDRLRVPEGMRRRAADSAWLKPRIWNRHARQEAKMAEALGMEHKPPLIFPSECDPFEDFDGPIVDAQNRRLLRCECGGCHPEGDVCECDRIAWATFDDLRRDYFRIIDQCRNLVFPLLTKRPQNIQRCWFLRNDEEAISRRGGNDRDVSYRPNCYLLYSASNQPTLEAGIDHLLACRDLVPTIGLSAEPLLGPIDFHFTSGPSGVNVPGNQWREPLGPCGYYCDESVGHVDHTGIDWVIVGGESGPNYRPMELEWLISIYEQCKAAGVPLFVKQDCGRKQGMQGRIPDRVWQCKEFPRA